MYQCRILWEDLTEARAVNQHPSNGEAEGNGSAPGTDGAAPNTSLHHDVEMNEIAMGPAEEGIVVLMVVVVCSGGGRGRAQLFCPSRDSFVRIKQW